MTSPEAIRLSVREPADALLDEPFRVEASAPDGAALRWRARVRDDDGRVWRAWASSPAELSASWGPAKDGTGAVAALASLRPVDVDVRVEAEDGRAASRTLKRLLVAPQVKSRRWRGDVVATLHLPPEPVATVLIDATHPAADVAVPGIAAALLASRGVLALLVPAPRRSTPGIVKQARDQLAAVPGATDVRTVLAADLPLPPNVPARGAPATERWDALLADLGARPRDGGGA